jgi:hypothetical protein
LPPGIKEERREEDRMKSEGGRNKGRMKRQERREEDRMKSEGG